MSFLESGHISHKWQDVWDNTRRITIEPQAILDMLWGEFFRVPHEHFLYPEQDTFHVTTKKPFFIMSNESSIINEIFVPYPVESPRWVENAFIMILVPPYKHQVFKVYKEQGLHSSNGVTRKNVENSSHKRQQPKIIFRYYSMLKTPIQDKYSNNIS